MEKYHISNFLKIIIPICLLLAIMSPLVMAKLTDRFQAGPQAEIQLKLWEKGGKVVDLRVRLKENGARFNPSGDASPLTAYPFQFDVSEFGNVPVADIKGFAYGYGVTPAGRTVTPLMVRWWIVKKDRQHPDAPYALTLKLQTRDSSGIEFDPRRQQAILVGKNAVMAQSSRI